MYPEHMKEIIKNDYNDKLNTGSWNKDIPQ